MSLNGTKYRVGAVVFIGYTNDLPEFASIQEIIVLDAGIIYFIVKKLETIMFSSHFHSYEVRRRTDLDLLILVPQDLKVYLPMHTVKASVCRNGLLYVTPRYLPPKTML